MTFSQLSMENSAQFKVIFQKAVENKKKDNENLVRAPRRESLKFKKDNSHSDFNDNILKIPMFINSFN
jgi:hypothetical protein